MIFRERTVSPDILSLFWSASGLDTPQIRWRRLPYDLGKVRKLIGETDHPPFLPGMVCWGDAQSIGAAKARQAGESDRARSRET